VEAGCFHFLLEREEKVKTGESEINKKRKRELRDSDREGEREREKTLKTERSSKRRQTKFSFL